MYFNGHDIPPFTLSWAVICLPTQRKVTSSKSTAASHINIQIYTEKGQQTSKTAQKYALVQLDWFTGPSPAPSIPSKLAKGKLAAVSQLA